MSAQVSIDIDVDVWEHLQREAVPFVDTPNAVLRRLLSLDEVATTSSATTSTQPTASGNRASRSAHRPSRARNGRTKPKPRKSAKRGRRASSSDLLAESEYELPILVALADAGGRAPTREALDAVGKALADRLTPTDRGMTSSGATRWYGRAQLVRLHLVKAGDMLSESPRGVWEISNQGRARVAAEANTE